MTKSSKIRIVLTVLALAVFTVVCFSIPAMRIKRFWLAYGCGVLAVLFMAWALIVTAGKEDSRERYYGFPTVRMARYYLMLQGAASVIEITSDMGGWGMFAINLPLLAFPVIGFITTRTVMAEIARQDAKRKKEAATA